MYDVQVAWHWLSRYRHVHAFDSFLGISSVVQACQVSSRLALGLSRPVISAIRGILSDLHSLHVHTCTRFGVELGYCHAWHVSCVLYDI